MEHRFQSLAYDKQPAADQIDSKKFRLKKNKNCQKLLVELLLSAKGDYNFTWIQQAKQSVSLNYQKKPVCSSKKLNCHDTVLTKISIVIQLLNEKCQS